ncbi:hypothetical protein [Thermococcus paralvinellae]|uniref:Uncharacterized protein n=1 Tax=Thermococcus paralvinellae TaxID=582419 RepID=W0I1X8_9EURY|nr:hypothetical protein [Thermococcus paralvinellae]AHF80014.1 Hypothetical protein TES1_0626 [Thermococcus paralvinellae]
MFEVVKILYRELHYQILKRNPQIANDEKKFKKHLKNTISIKRNVTIQSIAFVFFGIMMAIGLSFSDDKTYIVAMLSSLALIPFIFSLYVTAVQSSYVVSLGLFEPIKALPIRIGALYLSELLMIDQIPALAMILPSIAVVGIKYPLNGILALLWIFIGMLTGHTLGLIIYSTFGLRISYRKSKSGSLKNILKILAIFAFMGLFYGVSYMQEYIQEHSKQVGAIIGRYSIAYPFTISSIFEPKKSIILLLIYAGVFVPLYRLALKRVWSGILEPKLESERVRATGFKASLGGKMFALTLKDLRIIFRKTAMITGFLMPVYVLFPQIIMVLQSGNFPVSKAVYFLITLGVFTVPGADAVLKVEGKVLDFLKSLPLTKREYALSKALSMSVIPILISELILALAVHYNPQAIILLPYTFLLPLNASFLTMVYFFRYEGIELGIPEFNIGHMIVLMILVGILFGVIALPLLVLSYPFKYAVSFVISAVALIVLYQML